MRKSLIFKQLITAVALVAAGCSTNTTDAVQVNAPAPAVMRGAEMRSAPPINSAGPASMTVPSAESLAILAARSNVGGRVLGTIQAVGPSPSGNYTAPTGQVIPPALIANPQQTVNSSISSGPNPIITSGAGEGGGVFVATAAAPAATSAAVTAAPSSSAAITSPVTLGATANSGATVTGSTTAATTAQSVNFTGAAPIITTPATIATPANTASVLSVGQFAAGPGGATNTGAVAIANAAPLPTTTNTALVNGNSGTLTPTMSSSFNPSPTVASNPAVVVNGGLRTTNGTTAAPATRTTAASTATRTANARAVLSPVGAIGVNGMTSSSTIANNSNGSVITASVDEQLAARNALSNTTSSVTASATTSRTATGGGVITFGRQRAVITPANGVSAPITSSPTIAARQRAVSKATLVSAPLTTTPSRQRAVRITTSTNGTAVITNR